MSTPPDIDDGGPAFASATCGDWQYGMTLRDWFAGQAYQAAWMSMDQGYYDGGNKEIAECAYQMADAMIKARKQKGTSA